MQRKMRLRGVVAVLLVAGFVSGCGLIPGEELSIVSGSENESLEPIIDQFARRKNVRISMTYKGSVDMMLEMGQEQFPFDAVWPANSLWISLGDAERRRIKHVKSIMTSPVVFGIRESAARNLGWTDREVRVADILSEIRAGTFSFMMTSATQSNSGASAYMGFLYALLDNPSVITMEDLHAAELKTDIRDLLGGIHRSSGSSGWLKSLFVESDYDAMVNYEALMIEANRELIREGKEPLHVVYPVDGIVVADSPLGYVNKGDAEKEELFLELQEYLLSDEVQARLAENGRRTGLGGKVVGADPDVFNPDWGVEANRVLSPIRMPSADVIYEALRLYQTEYRKPSLTVFALDYSGSMSGVGESELESAMGMLLDQNEAQRYLLQVGERDEIIVVPFAEVVLDGWRITGNDQTTLDKLYARITAMEPNGGTDIYSPVIFGLEYMAGLGNLDSYQPAVIVMTDGESTETTDLSDLEEAYRRFGLDVPVFSIMFGNAVEEQLSGIAELTRARVFDGREDLVGAFRKVKGYN